MAAWVTTQVTNLNAVKTLQAINGVAASAGAAVKGGDILDYLVTVTNTGGANGGTQLQETVPAGTSFSAAAPSTGWSCADGAPALTACNQVVVAVAGGGTATANFRVVVNANTTGMTQIANTVASTVGTCTGCSVAAPLLHTLRIAKRSVGGVGSFGFTTSGVAPANDSIGTASDGVTVTSSTLHVGSVGADASITEGSGAFGYSTAVSCTDANSAATGNNTPITSALASVTIPGANMKAGAAYTCLYTNTKVVTNLSVVVTANPTTVQSGATVVYTLTVNNAGPAPANGAVLRDKPGVGVDCTPVPLPAPPSCVASGGAACPSAAALTASALTSTGGVPIPVLPSGGRVVVTLTCVASADGK